jgi:hypothetical protein
VSLLFGRVWVLLTVIRLRGTGADIFVPEELRDLAGVFRDRQPQAVWPSEEQPDATAAREILRLRVPMEIARLDFRNERIGTLLSE